MLEVIHVSAQDRKGRDTQHYKCNRIIFNTACSYNYSSVSLRNRLLPPCVSLRACLCVSAREKAYAHTMLRFPHGIRRAFLRPVWAPFRRCLPLLALLHSCPEDGDGGDDLLMNEAQNDAGDLLPTKSGETSYSSPIADEGLLLHTNADHAEGFFLAYHNGDSVDFNCSTPAPEGKSNVEEEILLPAAHDNPMLSITLFNGLLSSTIHVFDPGGCFVGGDVAFPSHHGADIIQDVAALYDSSLWLNARSNCKASVDSSFLIPLRGRRCDQWNDEAEHEDLAALKTKTKRTSTMMRLFYLMKDVLDPG